MLQLNIFKSKLYVSKRKSTGKRLKSNTIQVMTKQTKNYFLGLKTLKKLYNNWTAND